MGASVTKPIAVVTGASRGLGHEIAAKLALQGYEVFGLSRTESVHSGLFEFLETDLCSAESVRNAFALIRKRCGRINVLINNAAVLHSQYLMILPDRSIKSMTETNLEGTIIATREALKLMRRVELARVVTVSSMATVLKPEGDSVYAATKAGLEMFTSTVAKEVARDGITCNVLSISAFDSEMYRSLNEQRVGELIKQLPIPGFVDIDDVMNVIDFFLSPRSSGITAQVVRLGGVS